MNAPQKISLPDIQSQRDERELVIDAVGIRGVRYPVTVEDGMACVPTVATFALSVELPAEAKGTHMSRFVEVLEARHEHLDAAGFRELALAMTRRLGAARGIVEMRFPWFYRKVAPVSGVASLLDCTATWRASVAGARCRFEVGVVVPATSLCPCSKEISAYGAHNQRSHIAIEADLAGDVTIPELVSLAERSASCEVYGLLKRVDEKHVTERAYDNPKFVEDLVRDVATALRLDRRILGFAVEAENFESIHNHSAVARLSWPPRPEAEAP
ncbi:MAG: GTP cyclohydrolase FolE2 [Nevskiaceae bacterium]